MGQDPISFIIQLFVQLYAFIIILRFLLQVSKADYYNPISQAVVKLTSKPLAPLQESHSPHWQHRYFTAGVCLSDHRRRHPVTSGT